MTAHPISEAAAKIAREDAVIDIAFAAMALARRLGTTSRDPLASIFNDRIKIQARRLLIEATLHLYGVNALAERKILGSLSSIDLAGAYDHEAMAEFWQIVEDTAREEARDNRERMGDAA